MQNPMVITKPHFDCFDKKSTPEFAGHIQAIIDNDPIVKDRVVSEFLIRQVVHENIQYSSNRMRMTNFCRWP